MPKLKLKLEDRNKSFLLAIESSIIRPENFDKSLHQYFQNIFTWNDDLVDNKKYIKMNYSFAFPTTIYKSPQRKKLCCLIVGNKSSKFSHELYSERKNLIRWFEKEQPEDFDLYGVGWNEYTFVGNRLIRGLNRLQIFKKIGMYFWGETFVSYKGKIDSKTETLRNYRFSIAYENAHGDAGYITEKIFDIFVAGCVPVYLGARNITDYIPPNCFIDRRNFENHQDLYVFLKNMKDDVYTDYLNNIEKYLNSEQSYQFSSQNFAKLIVGTCIGKKLK